MKVYVDELPKSCEKCPLCDCNGFDNDGWCKAFGDKIVYIAEKNFKEKRLQSCPLQSLTDYTKQVRKEVCEEFKENIENIEKSIVNNPSYFDNEERKRLVEKAVYKNVFKFLDKERSK